MNTTTTLIYQEDNVLARKVFWLTLFFFLLLQGYGIYYCELRMQTDAADDVIRYAASNGILPPQPVFFRYAYLLNKVLLKAATWLHMPIHSVASWYCINDMLFYLCISVAIMWLTRCYHYAAIVLAAATLLPFLNFYYIFNELFLSGAIMLLYLAVHERMAHSLWRTFLLIVCIFFMVFTHPAMLIVLSAFVPGMYGSVKQVKNDAWILGFMVGIVVLRVILFSDYDQSHIQRINGTFDWKLSIGNVVDYMKLYWYLPILTIYGILVASRAGQARAYIGLLILPVTVYLLGQNNVHVLDANFSKYVYPLSLLMLTLGFTAVLRYSVLSHTTVLLLVALVFVSTGTMFIDMLHHRLAVHASVLKTITAISNEEDDNHSKWYVNNPALVNIDPLYTGVNSESILFSVLAGHTTTAQIVNIVPADTAAMQSLDTNLFYLNGSAALPIEQLDTVYFNFKPGAYRELILNEERLNTIRNAANAK